MLTHSGDQAWDFAVPLALISVFPGNLDVVALYYLLVRFAHMVLVSRVCGLMDQWDRLKAIRCGIGLQTVGVILAAFAIHTLSITDTAALSWFDSRHFIPFALLLSAGLAASLGSTMMDVAVAQDWIPTIVPPEDLARVNSRLRQVDLVTELSAPVAAGLLLALSPPDFLLLGFFGVAIWNIISFVPEYRLLQQVYRREAHISQKARLVSAPQKPSLLESLSIGWREFLTQPAALSMVAYALLWVTVLSPHGVLLTAWLKTEWGLSESSIGLVRGLGAVFGLSATMVFPRVLARLGLVGSARFFILWEAACLIGAGLAFYFGKAYAPVFLGLILLSRIGLYGFSLGETEIRQRSINPDARGRVNGFANALTSLATLGVYGAGSLLKDPGDFGRLVYGSIAFVALGALTFTAWSVASAIPLREGVKEVG